MKNLVYKQNLAVKALTEFNQKYKQNYRFIQRISYDYASDPYSSKKEQIHKYWNTFKSNNIPFVLYRTDQGFLYGTYYNTKWYFVLKELLSGKIHLNLACSVLQSDCSIL